MQHFLHQTYFALQYSQCEPLYLQECVIYRRVKSTSSSLVMYGFCNNKALNLPILPCLLIQGQQLDGSYKFGSVHSSLCSGVFSDLDHSFFLNFWHGARNPRSKLSQKQFFLNLFKNQSLICSIMKICIICCVSVHNLFLVKILFLRYGSKCSMPMRLQNF